MARRKLEVICRVVITDDAGKEEYVEYQQAALSQSYAFNEKVSCVALQQVVFPKVIALTTKKASQQGIVYALIELFGRDIADLKPPEIIAWLDLDAQDVSDEEFRTKMAEVVAENS